MCPKMTNSSAASRQDHGRAIKTATILCTLNDNSEIAYSLTENDSNIYLYTSDTDRNLTAYAVYKTKEEFAMAMPHVAKELCELAHKVDFNGQEIGLLNSTEPFREPTDLRRFDVYNAKSPGCTRGELVARSPSEFNIRQQGSPGFGVHGGGTRTDPAFEANLFEMATPVTRDVEGLQRPTCDVEGLQRLEDEDGRNREESQSESSGKDRADDRFDLDEDLSSVSITSEANELSDSTAHYFQQATPVDLSPEPEKIEGQRRTYDPLSLQSYDEGNEETESPRGSESSHYRSSFDFSSEVKDEEMILQNDIMATMAASDVTSLLDRDDREAMESDL